MDDLLTRHADNVAKANAEHLKDLTALRERADAAIREKIALFGAKMLDLVKAADEARETLAAELDMIVRTISGKAEDAFSDNVAAISLSAADFHRELDARAEFLRTGQLPIEDKLPKDEPAKDGEERAAA